MKEKLLILLGLLNESLQELEPEFKFRGRSACKILIKEIEVELKRIDKAAQVNVGKQEADEAMAAINEYTLIFDKLFSVVLGLEENEKLKKAIEDNL